MKDINIAINGLVEAIRESQVYKDYTVSKSILESRPELKRKVDEYRFKNMLLQEDKETVFDKSFEMQKEYAQVLNDPYVRAYLTAESALCRIFQKVNYSLLDDLEFEMEYGEDING